MQLSTSIAADADGRTRNGSTGGTTKSILGDRNCRLGNQSADDLQWQPTRLDLDLSWVYRQRCLCRWRPKGDKKDMVTILVDLEQLPPPQLIISPGEDRGISVPMHVASEEGRSISALPPLQSYLPLAGASRSTRKSSPLTTGHTLSAHPMRSRSGSEW